MSSNNNVSFDYRYRDAGNYKKEGSVIFRNEAKADLAALDEEIKSLLISTEFFLKMPKYLGQIAELK